MNKMANLMETAARLAAQQHGLDDVMDWQGPQLATRLAKWCEDQAKAGEHIVLADVAPANCSAFEKAASVTATWSALGLNDAPMPEGWCVSRRYLGDLGLDEEAVLTAARQTGDLKALRDALAETSDTPWIGSATTDRVVAPFLLNMGDARQRQAALAEVVRILNITGHFESVVLAADEPLSECHRTVIGYPLMRFPLEHAIAGELTQAGFHGVRLTPLLDGPVMTVDGVELRAFALSAFTGTKGVCLDQGDAAIYLGPWSEVTDDDGHTYPRGVRIAVCAKTAAVLRRPPYAGLFVIVPAYQAPPLEEAPLFDCSRDVVRPAAETKGRVGLAAGCCDEGCDC
ncbi:hypothetical protein [Breoghania sp.]|uniref:hypothetical protein n=1 Tax=Breoghania sp. TaxID=2065378 RepID=UPI0029CA0B02|nr:hypothetical protein [Breoghania sp.]